MCEVIVFKCQIIGSAGWWFLTEGDRCREFYSYFGFLTGDIFFDYNARRENLNRGWQFFRVEEVQCSVESCGGEWNFFLREGVLQRRYFRSLQEGVFVFLLDFMLCVYRLRFVKDRWKIIREVLEFVRGGEYWGFNQLEGREILLVFGVQLIFKKDYILG